MIFSNTHVNSSTFELSVPYSLMLKSGNSSHYAYTPETSSIVRELVRDSVKDSELEEHSVSWVYYPTFSRPGLIKKLLHFLVIDVVLTVPLHYNFFLTLD